MRLRRELALLARGDERIDWARARVVRTPAVLQDDCAIASRSRSCERNVYVDGARVELAPAALLGQGGEAEVYDLDDGRVVKWWKPADHPDFDGLPDAQAAAAQRIAEAPAKLRALPGNLPAAVVAPCGLALAASGRRGRRLRDAEGRRRRALHSYGEPQWRREHPVAGEDVVAALLALHDAIAGCIAPVSSIGDCNDLNVLVDGRARSPDRRR